MKTLIASMLTFVMAVMVGCQSSSPRGGGMTKDVGFKIVVPTFDTEIKQGEVQSMTISLERGDYFKQDVELQIQASTPGISVDPTNVLVKSSGSPEVHVRVAAPKNAPIGDYTIYVKGLPETGEPTSTVFIVKVVSP